MTISYTCPYCGLYALVGDEEAGRTVLCSGCGAPVVVPEAGPFNPYQSPQTIWTSETGAGELEGGWGWILFSFDGRIPRRTWWLAHILKNIVIFGAFFLHTALAEAGAYDSPGNPKILGTFLVLSFMAVGITWFWITLAITCKRFHDRDKSGWWYLITCIPYIGPLWLFIECGCLRGTYGMNTYGPDPT